MNIAQKDYFASGAAYEAAISFASERAPCGSGLPASSRASCGNQDRAIEHLQNAESLAPESAFVKLEFARVLQYQPCLMTLKIASNQSRTIHKR